MCIEVYPRVCGGARNRRFERIADKGLSPRVRGSLVNYVILWMRGGSIPACAGEPATQCQAVLYVWVYPRVCGGACQTQPSVL